VHTKNNLRGRVVAVDMLLVANTLATAGIINFMLQNCDVQRVFCGQEMKYLKWKGIFLNM
jgi:hypothetical protein